MSIEQEETALQKLMIVGAFPPVGMEIFGGVITGCRLLLESSLPTKVQLILIDSTQISNPAPGLLVRAFGASVRAIKFVKTLA